MSQITFKGNPIHTVGSLPEVGTVAQEFTLVGADLSEKHLADYTGKKVLLNIFPSIDTGVCAASARQFNKEEFFGKYRCYKRFQRFTFCS